MALLDSRNSKRFDVPHEPGAWVELRPVTAGDVELLDVQGANIRFSLDLLARLITAWSYAEAPSTETVRLLDLDTYVWLSRDCAAAVMKFSGVRDAGEKKSSSNGSSSRTRRAIPASSAGSSLVNSPTS